MGYGVRAKSWQIVGLMPWRAIRNTSVGPLLNRRHRQQIC